MRLVGALLAGLIALAFVGVQLLLEVPLGWPDPNPVALIAPLAVVIAPLLALRHARRVVQARDFEMSPVATFALESVLLGSVSVSAIALIAAVSRGVGYEPVDALVGFVQLTILGLVFLGIPVFVVALLAVSAWAIALRATSRRLSLLGDPQILTS
jgi:hypothetical protein